jgi:hypothetical protein
MVSSKIKIFITGIGIIGICFLLPTILRHFLGIEINLTTGIPYISIAGILLIVSAFLPATFAKVCRNITYLILFVFILIVEIQLLQPFIQVSQVNITECKSFFFPEVKESVSNVIINALGITSCMLTGYFPQEQSILGWLSFLLFYIILPFAFIFALIVGLMRDVLQGILDRRILNVFSFIIAVYATRAMFGAFLLQFLGYSAWGLAGIFGAIFIVGSLRKMIEGWFKIETYAEEIRKYYEVQKSIKQQYAELALKKVKELKTYLSNVKLTGTLADEVIFRAVQSAIESLKDISFFKSLTNDEQKVINEAIEHINTFLASKDLKSVIATLDQLEKVLEIWKK